jgi:hypothetical protein
VAFCIQSVEALACEGPVEDDITDEREGRVGEGRRHKWFEVGEGNAAVISWCNAPREGEGQEKAVVEDRETHREGLEGGEKDAVSILVGPEGGGQRQG